MTVHVNTVLGLAAGLIGVVVGLATMLLVFWQAPRQRNNLIMTLYLSTVVGWGLAGFLLNGTVLINNDPTFFYHVAAFMTGLNTIANFVLIVHYAGIGHRWTIRLLVVAGVCVLGLSGPPLFENRLFAFQGISPDGLFMVEFTQLGIPVVIGAILFQFSSAGLVWAHRHSRVGSVLPGTFVATAAVLSNSLPQISSYSLDGLLAAVASLLFARAILREQLFKPLLTLNADLAESNARLTELSDGLQRAANELHRAKEAAEAANRAKSTFLASMSHELRTPLTAILGYSDLIEQELVLQQQDDLVTDLHKIQVSGRHLLALISDILDLSKIEAGRIEIQLSHFEIRDLVGEVCCTIETLAQQNGNTLLVECDPEVGSMVSDKLKLRQVLFNVLGNACKFTEYGSIRFAVKRASQPASVVFTITDSGIGMTPEQIAHLFEAFTHVDTSTTRQRGGSGLGLAISQHYCQLLGGTISAASQPGAGSVFTITLPAESPGPASLPTLLTPAE